MIHAKKVVYYTILVSIILLIISYKFGGEYILMTGALSEGHETLSGNCNKCHTPFKNDFKACSTCHLDVKEISLHSKEGPVKCIFCHIGHDTKYNQIELLDPMTCLSTECHEKMSKIPDHSADPEICFNCHPEHPFEKKMPDIKVSDLIFSHKVHSNGVNQKAYYPCRSCHQISNDGIKVDTPLALVQCKKCHADWVAKHDVKKSIKEKECAICHYPQKKEIKLLGKKFLLQHARFSHQIHLNLECTTCHFQMETFDELENIFIFSSKNKKSFCTQCHFNPFMAKN